jgi:Sap, sulfolipid-1-addressing protein
VFVVLVLAVVEIILVLNMAAPAKTRAALRLLHDWSGARRRQILVAIFIVVGVTLMAQGMGGM